MHNVNTNDSLPQNAVTQQDTSKRTDLVKSCPQFVAVEVAAVVLIFVLKCRLLHIHTHSAGEFLAICTH